MIEYIDGFVLAIHNSGELLSKINDESAGIKKSVSKWSRKETLGHLIDSANVNYNRFITAVDKDDLMFGTYPQNKWVEIQSYNERDWTDLIKLWKTINLHLAELVNNIPEDKRTRLISLHNFDQICWKGVKKEEKSSLDYLIKDYIGHLEHHLKQIYDY